jgi:ABC-type transport system involved in multi-copper enzyme maturation permease subunit
MPGLLSKAIYETWLATLLFALALLLVMGLLTFVLPQVQENIGDVLERIPFVKSLIAALLGIDVEGELTAQLMQSVLWVHPTVLSLIWAYEIIICTRIPAGEVDRGTIDILLGLPVARWSVYLAESAVWLAGGLLVLSCGMLGYWGMHQELPGAPVSSRATWYVLLNLFCVYLAVGGLSLLISSLNDRRGWAIGIIFAILLASFLINFLAPLWEPARYAAPFSFMHYYQPAEIMRTSTLPARNLLVLLTAAGATWLAGGLVFSRRDLCTV